jgi:hypothetical protein
VADLSTLTALAVVVVICIAATILAWVGYRTQPALPKRSARPRRTDRGSGGGIDSGMSTHSDHGGNAAHSHGSGHGSGDGGGGHGGGGHGGGGHGGGH